MWQEWFEINENSLPALSETAAVLGIQPTWNRSLSAHFRSWWWWWLRWWWRCEVYHDDNDDHDNDATDKDDDDDDDNSENDEKDDIDYVDDNDEWDDVNDVDDDNDENDDDDVDDNNDENDDDDNDVHPIHDLECTYTLEMSWYKKHWFEKYMTENLFSSGSKYLLQIFAICWF